MKKAQLLTLLLLLGHTIFSQSQYGAWASTTDCYVGFSARIKNMGLVKSVNKYEYHAQVRNDYGRRVHFDMNWIVGGEEQKIGRFLLSPRAITNAVSYF